MYMWELEPAKYMCKETAENGERLKEYCCMHASQVNYSAVCPISSDCNKILRRNFS